jgi:hypothetical protein
VKISQTQNKEAKEEYILYTSTAGQGAAEKMSRRNKLSG